MDSRGERAYSEFVVLGSAGRKSRAERRKLASSSGAVADVVGAVGSVCHIDAPVVTAHHTVSDAPELPPRAPIHGKPASRSSYRKSRSRSPGLSGSMSPTKRTPMREDSQIHEDSLDVFVPLGSTDPAPTTDHKTADVQKRSNGLDPPRPTICPSISADGREHFDDDPRSGVLDEDDYLLPIPDRPESKQPLLVNVAAESGQDRGSRNALTRTCPDISEHYDKDPRGELDALVSHEDDYLLPIPERIKSRQPSFVNASAERNHDRGGRRAPVRTSPDMLSDGQEHFDKDPRGGLDALISHEDDYLLPVPERLESKQPLIANVSDRGTQRAPSRIRPNIVRRLTRKETTKLSRGLTRKMSCRQQHALMMDAEFDEFDDLDVVVEGEDDDDDDDDRLSTGDAEQRDVLSSDSSDVGFDERVTAKLHYDRLQVYSVFRVSPVCWLDALFDRFVCLDCHYWCWVSFRTESKRHTLSDSCAELNRFCVASGCFVAIECDTYCI